ncbi:MAG: prephenate dehydrogenase/arogenate dehydrogenase family protein, partial [Ginsengibacter sp.]
MNVAIVGTGLIGGSMAIALKEKNIADKIIGVESNKQYQQRALDLSLVDEINDLDEAVQKSDVVILAVPVDAAIKMISQVLDKTENQIIIDVGSTKSAICKAVVNHSKRRRFVATHPMWGTEYRGPDAATIGAFVDKAVVICDKAESDVDALEFTENMYRKIGMHLIYMNSIPHDVHAAYVSHISHITSFALANTVLEKEREEDAIFELASGGFESTVRL